MSRTSPKISVVVHERYKRNTLLHISVRLPFCYNLSRMEQEYFRNELRKSVRIALLMQFGQRAAEIKEMLEGETKDLDLFS